MIKELTDYYSLLRKQERIEADTSEKNIDNVILLDENGDIYSIAPYKETKFFEKKKNGTNEVELVPKEVSRKEKFPYIASTSTIKTYLFEYRPIYIFGLKYDEESKKCIVDKGAKKSFECFKKEHKEFLKDCESEIGKRVYKFIEKWVPEENTENDLILNCGAKLFSEKVIFALKEDLSVKLNTEIELLEKFERQKFNSNVNGENIGICCVTGKRSEIAKTHDKASSIGTGVTLVCCNNKCDDSYGKTQGFNCCVSVEAMQKYTKALMYLFSSRNHNKKIGNCTYLYWSQDDNDENECELFGDIIIDKQNIANPADEKLNSIFNALSRAVEPDWRQLKINENAPFHILGLVQNVSRLSVRCFYKNTFGRILVNVANARKEMSLGKENEKQLTISSIMKETVSSVSKSDVANNGISNSLFHAMLFGSSYPNSLFVSVVRRAKIETDKTKDFSFERKVRIIKACLLRTFKKGDREEFMKLDVTNMDKGYICGRLFAILEYIQKTALVNSINTTIKDRFFGTACSNPSVVFTRIIKLSQNHLSKIGGGLAVKLDKLLQEVLCLLDVFPSTLNMQEQGEFILGYYHQKEAFYTKKTDDENINKNLKEEEN